MGQDCAPDKELRDPYRNDHEPGQSIDPADFVHVQHADDVRELIDVSNFREGRENSCWERGRELSVMKDDVALVSVGE